LTRARGRENTTRRPTLGSLALSPCTASYVLASIGCLSSPSALLAIAVLLVNDHVLKVLAPSWLTGKLSDVAGLFFAPYLALLLAFTVVWLAQMPIGVRVGRRPMLPLPVADSLVTSVFVALGALFASLKLDPLTAGPALRLLELVTGSSHTVVVDPSDLLALVVLPLSYAQWRGQIKRQMQFGAALGRNLARAGRLLAIVLAGVATVATSSVASYSVVSLAVDPGEPGALYALIWAESHSRETPSRHTIYRAAGSRSIWRQYGASVVTSGPGRAIPDLLQSGRVYVAVPGAVWRLDGSAPARRIWPPVDGPIDPGDAVMLPAVVPSWSAGALYVGATGALMRTVDGGENWATLPLPGPPNLPVSAFATGSEAGLLVAAQERRLWRSRDGGTSWERLAELAADPTGLWIHPRRSDLLLAATPATLLASDDGGLTWRSAGWDVGPTSPISRLSIAFDPASEASILAAVPGNGVLQSDDGGHSWRRVLPINALDILVTPAPVNDVLVASRWSGVFLRRGWLRWPGVGEWEPVNAGIPGGGPIGGLPTGLTERVIEVGFSMVTLTLLVAAVLLAAHAIAPPWLRRVALTYPWEIALTVWTFASVWLFLDVLLHDRGFSAVMVATVPALGALVILMKTRWTSLVWGLEILPPLFFAVVLAVPQPGQRPWLLPLAAVAILAVATRIMPARAAKPLLIVVSGIVCLTLWGLNMLRP
jgi:hypothetical protein